MEVKGSSICRIENIDGRSVDVRLELTGVEVLADKCKKKKGPW